MLMGTLAGCFDSCCPRGCGWGWGSRSSRSWSCPSCRWRPRRPSTRAPGSETDHPRRSASSATGWATRWTTAAARTTRAMHVIHVMRRSGVMRVMCAMCATRRPCDAAPPRRARSDSSVFQTRFLPRAPPRRPCRRQFSVLLLISCATTTEPLVIPTTRSTFFKTYVLTRVSELHSFPGRPVVSRISRC